MLPYTTKSMPYFSEIAWFGRWRFFREHSSLPEQSGSFVFNNFKEYILSTHSRYYFGRLNKMRRARWLRTHYTAISRWHGRVGSMKYDSVRNLFKTMDILQVQTVDGTWIPVQPIKNSIVVNTGELLEYWTGGYYSATVSIWILSNVEHFCMPTFYCIIQRHRVVVPKEEMKKKCSRQSLVYFIQPDDNVNVVPVRPDSSGILQPPVNSREHSMLRLETTYGVNDWINHLQELN